MQARKPEADEQESRPATGTQEPQQFHRGKHRVKDQKHIGDQPKIVLKKTHKDQKEKVAGVGGRGQIRGSKKQKVAEHL